MEFLLYGQWGFAAKLFQLQVGLEVAEGFLDAPAPMVQRGEVGSRKGRLVQQVGGQHFDLTAWEQDTDQSQREGVNRNLASLESLMLHLVWVDRHDRGRVLANDAFEGKEATAGKVDRLTAMTMNEVIRRDDLSDFIDRFEI